MLGGEPQPEGQPPEGQTPEPPMPEQPQEEPTDLLPDAEEEDIKRFNLDINDTVKGIDKEEIDRSEE